MNWIDIEDYLVTHAFGNTNRPNNVQICLNALGKDGDYYIWFFGDFVCDDVLNIEECDYDGGDCCRDIETVTEACMYYL